MSRFKGVLIFLVGLVLVMLGLGMWRSPEINWNGFLAEWVVVANEVARLISDPFAVVGILVLAVGTWIAINGLRRLIRG